LGEILQAVLSKGFSIRFKAKGFSMFPVIKDGDIITVSPFPGVSIRSGNIIAFIHPQTEKLVVHRLIETKENGFLTKGDNSLETDGDIPGTYILGKVTRIEKKGKSRLMKKFFGLIRKPSPQNG
jgi:signal peptidase I